MTIIPPTEIQSVDSSCYGGFVSRFWALVVDHVIFYSVVSLVLLVVGAATTIGQIVTWPISGGMFVWEAHVNSGQAHMFQLVLVHWLYFALQESSSRQATFGKRLLGLRVVTQNGASVSFVRASVRYFAKYLSGSICFLGFIMAAFTPKHQALHDLLAETFVVRRS